MKNYRGFIGIELGIAIAIIAVLGIAAVTGYTTYHARMTASDVASTTDNGTSATQTGDGSASSTSTSGTVTTGSVTITSEASGQVAHMHVGDHLTLALPGDIGWGKPTSSNESVIHIINAPMNQQDQAVFMASAKGTATISTSGVLICAAGVMCPDHAIAVDITVIVD